MEQAFVTQEELITLLNFAGFQLSKWCVDTPKLLEKTDPKNIESGTRISFDDKDIIKTLGMYRVPRNHTFRICFDKPNVIESHKKR